MVSIRPVAPLTTAPLALAAPAAAAGLAYLNARWLAGYDALLLRSIINAYARANLRERRDRLNQFYVLEERAKTKSSANKNFIVFEDRSHTYAQVYDAALRYGTWFKQRFGIKPGDIVALDFQNSDTFLFLVFGLWAIGAKPAFMNYNLTGKGLAHCVRTATAKLVIVDPAVMCNVDDALRAELGPGVDFVELTPAVEAEVMATRAERWPDQDRHEDLQRNMAILIYTSGTTGMPKAAIVSWSKLIVGGNFAAWFMGHKSTDVFYTVRRFIRGSWWSSVHRRTPAAMAAKPAPRFSSPPMTSQCTPRIPYAISYSPQPGFPVYAFANFSTPPP